MRLTWLKQRWHRWSWRRGRMTAPSSRTRRYYDDDSSEIDEPSHDRTARSSRNRNRHKKKTLRSQSIYSAASFDKTDDEPAKRKCSLPCQKKTILVGGLIILHIAVFVGIGMFFGEQQRELNKHEHLLIYLHQQKFSCTKDIKKLADDMKHVVKDGGGEKVMTSRIIEDVKSIQKENDHVRDALIQYTGDISSLRNIILQVNNTVLALYNNYTQHVALKKEFSSEEKKNWNDLQETYSKDIGDIKLNAEKMNEVIKQLQNEMAKEVDVIGKSSNGAADAIKELRTEIVKEFEVVAGKSEEANKAFNAFKEQYKDDKEQYSDANKFAFETFKEQYKDEYNDANKAFDTFKEQYKDEYNDANKAFQTFKEQYKVDYNDVNNMLSNLKDNYDSQMSTMKGDSGGVNATLVELKKGLHKDIKDVKGEVALVKNALVDMEKEFKKDIGTLKEGASGSKETLHTLQASHKKDIDKMKSEAADVLQLLQDYKEDMAKMKTGSANINTTFLQFKKDLSGLQDNNTEVNNAMQQMKKKFEKEIKDIASAEKNSLTELGEDLPDMKMKITDLNTTMFQLHGIYAKDILIVYNLSSTVNTSINTLEQKYKKDARKVKKDFSKIQKTLTKLKENVTGDTTLLKSAVTEGDDDGLIF